MAALLRGVLAAGLLLLAGAPAAAQGTVTPRDLEAALDRLDGLGGLFGAFAARETNDFARERWRRLSLGYPGTAEILRSLLARGVLLIDDLPGGRVSGLLDRGEIVIDRDLDGRWERGTAAARRGDLLLPALFEALARRQPPQDWPWLADHLRAVGGLGVLAQDPVARPLLARFFHAKDAYLWLAMQRIGEGDPAARKALAERQVKIFAAVRGLATDMAATFGPAPAERLQGDWSGYVALVDGFAVTRGWLLLDPALSRTQLGDAARAEADAVDRAAAEVVASAPRSALAATRAENGRSEVAQSAPRPAPEPAPVTLQSLVGEATEQPATPEDQPAAEDLPLQARLDALVAALEARAGEAARLEAALAAERERRAAAEQRAAAAALAAPERLAEAEAPPPKSVAPPPAADSDPAALPGVIGHRLLMVVAAAAAVVVLALLLWPLARRRAATGAPARRLLRAPTTEGLARTVIEVPEATPPAAARPKPAASPSRPDRSRAAYPQGRPPRINGVTPPTAAAKAAMKAGSAQRAARAAETGAAETGAAERGAAATGAAATAAPSMASEADTAASPIVQALRKGNLPLFELLFGELTALRTPQLQRIVYGGRGEDLAIVCRAVGVDKLLFGTIYLLTDHLRGGAAEEEAQRASEILLMYDRMPPSTARKVLAKWQSNWSGRREPSADG